jgi:hypothetical protein
LPIHPSAPAVPAHLDCARVLACARLRRALTKCGPVDDTHVHHAGWGTNPCVRVGESSSAARPLAE